MLSRGLIRWAYAVSAPTIYVVGCGLLWNGCNTSKIHTRPPVAADPEPERTDPPVVYKHGGEKLTVAVGREGGKLELANGARLEIPAGALSETAEITFSEGAHTTAFANHEYERPVGPTLQVGPTLNLKKPFKLSVPLGKMPEGFTAKDLTLAAEVMSDSQRAVPMQGTQTRWDYLPATSTSERAVAELAQIPGYRVQFVVSKGN